MSDTTGTSTKERLANLVLGGGIQKDGMSNIEQLLASNPPTVGGVSEFKGGVNFNALAYGAKLDGVTDDTAAWYSGTGSGVFEAVGANGGQTLFPVGVSVVSGPLNQKTKTQILGTGRASSVFQTTAAFGGLQGVLRGVIHYTGGGSTVFAYNEVRNCGADLRLTTDSTVSFIVQTGGVGQDGVECSMQHFLADDLQADLSAAANATHHGLLHFDALGAGASASFDIRVSNLYCHNGDVAVALYANGKSGKANLYHTVSIDNIVNVIDTNGSNDDRVAIAGNSAVAGCEVRNISVSRVFAHIASGLTSGLVHLVKMDTGTNTYLHARSVRDVFYYNASGAAISAGSPVIDLIGAGSTMQDISVDGVWAYQSNRISLKQGRNEANPTITISNVVIRSCIDPIGAIEIGATTNPSGDEYLSIRDCTLHNSATKVGNLPVAIMLTGAPSSAGGGGMTLIDGLVTANFQVGISNNLNEAGSVVGSGWSPVCISHYQTNNQINPLNQMVNTWSVRDSPTYTPHGTVTTPGIVTTLVTNTTGTDCMVYITTGGTNNVPVISLNGVTTGQVVPINATGIPVALVPALGGTIQLTGATLAGTSWKWVGVS